MKSLAISLILYTGIIQRERIFIVLYLTAPALVHRPITKTGAKSME